jgi:hypothetical protein
MSCKRLLTISLLFPLVAVSGIAHAGSTITDKSYWPGEIGPAAHGIDIASGNPNSAFAFDRSAPNFQAAPTASYGNSGSSYQGGPKSFMTRTPQ